MREAEKIVADVLQKSLERREIPGISRSTVETIAGVIVEALEEPTETMLAAAEALDDPDAGVFVGRDAARAVFQAMIGAICPAPLSSR